MLAIDTGTRWNFILEDTDQAAFAASELKKYIDEIMSPVIGGSRQDGPEIRVTIGRAEWVNRTAGEALVDTAKLRLDGYFLKITDGNVIISGAYGRSLMYGAYSLLEAAGCRWYFPGELGEYIPKTKSFTIGDREIYDNPDFEHRSFTDGCFKSPVIEWTEECFEMIDWMCKNKCNALNIHNDPADEPVTWDLIVAELAKRGMITETGGHGVQNYVKRELFATRPELFREKDGARAPDGNFCATNPESVKMVSERIKEILRTTKGIDILHLCFDDVEGGSWCACEKCREIEPINQMYGVIEAVGEAIADEFPGVRIDMVLYHDTLDAGKIGPAIRGNVLGVCGLRERCYAHAIDDPNCEHNKYYSDKLIEIKEKFGDKTYVHDYYDDLILFLKMKVNTPTAIKGDLIAYKKMGINYITSLAFGRYSWWAYEFNMLAYARLTWDTGCDHEALLDEMCERLYPSNAAAAAAYYRKLEEASTDLLSFCGYPAKDDFNDIRHLNVLKDGFSARHVKMVANAAKIFEGCAAALENFAPAGTLHEKMLIEQQKLIIDLTAKQAHATETELRCRQAKADGATDLEPLGAEMEAIMQDELAMEAWIKTVPVSIKGVAGRAIFEKHLCNDACRMYRAMRRRIMAP